MDSIILWLGENWEYITAVMVGASAIANATPNETDNKVIAMVNKVLGFVSLNFNVKGIANK